MINKKIQCWLLVIFIPLSLCCKVPFSTYEEIVSVHKLVDYTYKSVIVPRLFINKMPEEIKNIHGAKRARFFIKTILPLILLENENIEKERELVLSIAKKDKWNKEDLKKIHETALKYKIISNNDDISKFSKEEKERIWYFLDHRIRPVPPPIALGMAALESGWGSSRFAIEGNNLFGHTTQDTAKGIKPINWKGTERHIKKFDSLTESISSYLLNINRHRAYRKFRNLRREYPNNYAKLSEGFSKYSRIEDEYIERLKMIINKFELYRYFDARLDSQQRTEFVEKIKQPYIN